ncbi:MAG TPA: lysophospholipid acyltransferase family protein [Methylomirabilota bacterium]|nr:lysophospholipid acyltransferase family protein [Methylomirabilota bacterium]
MKGLLRHPLRVTGRFIWFLGFLLTAALDFLVHCAFRKNSTLAVRSLWLQRNSRRVLNIFRLQPQVVGTIPSHGLLVSNHLSYVDVPVIASIMPAVFVAKREIKYWPAIGWLTQMAGTLFVDRERRTQVGKMNNEIQRALDDGALVVLFPEGTSSNGETLLPFKSALLQPAVKPTQPLFICCVQYALEDGDASNDICYWGDHTFFPHLLNLMSQRNIRATVRFAPFQSQTTDRKELARQLREEVLKLKNG